MAEKEHTEDVYAVRPENPAEPMRIDIPLLLTLGIVSVIVLYVIVVGVQTWLYRLAEAQRRQTDYPRVPRQLAEYREDQHNLLHNARWIDQKKGIIAIDIEKAMALYVARHTQEQAGEQPSDKTTQ